MTPAKYHLTTDKQISLSPAALEIPSDLFNEESPTKKLKLSEARVDYLYCLQALGALEPPTIFENRAEKSPEEFGAA
ncbi:hypothetical protein PHJA_001795800 [Phtheirospermum japonicum]|uniref:Uncharacterized protein n=1 Tax=Phtheirospermum japonicum TaxID=374723 RepID=A0A830C728_9LAMI|nr:hypothetical protein PHJA_001795800 [Phtheirospermum japonicum]